MIANTEDKTLCPCAPAEKIAKIPYRYASVAEPRSNVRPDRLIERILDLDNHEARELDALAGADSASFARDPAGFCTVLQQAVACGCAGRAKWWRKTTVAHS